VIPIGHQLLTDWTQTSEIDIDAAADIYVKSTNDPAAPYSASYRRVLDGVALQAAITAAIREIMVLAAGAKAEAVCFG
jgi:hypothetical protein